VPTTGRAIAARFMSRGANNPNCGNVRSYRQSRNTRFAGLFWLCCKPRCRSIQPSEGRPILGTHVRLQANANGTSDRRRRPDDRLRHARRVRARARWENSAELRNSHPSPGPRSLLGAAAARWRSSIRSAVGPLQPLDAGVGLGSSPRSTRKALWEGIRAGPSLNLRIGKLEGCRLGVLKLQVQAVQALPGSPYTGRGRACQVSGPLRAARDGCDTRPSFAAWVPSRR
jgi:hypothetical protein